MAAAKKQSKQELIAELREEVWFTGTGVTGLCMLLVTTAATLLFLGLAANAAVQSVVLLGAIACNLMWGVLVIIGRGRKINVFRTNPEA